MFPVAVALVAALLQTSPEIALTAPNRNASPFSESLQGISAGDESALLVWADEIGLRATRIDRAGNNIDAVPMLLAERSRRADVVRADGRWLVVWWYDDRVLARFVDDDGSLSPLLDVGASLVDMNDDVKVVANRTGFLVTFDSTVERRVLRLDRDGRAVAGSPVLPESAFTFEPVAFDDGFAIVWATEARTIEILRIDEAGERRETLAKLDMIPNGVRAIADGDELVLAWTSWNGNRSDAWMMREGNAPRMIAPAAGALADSFALGGKVHALLVQYPEEVVRVASEDGTVRVLQTNATALWADVASFGDGALVAVEVSPLFANSHDLRLRVIDATLSDAGTDRRVAADVPEQTRPAIARGANGESLAVWVESGTDTPGAAVGAILDANGRPVGAPIVIARLSSVVFARVDVASDGTDYLVLVGDRLTAHTQRVLRDGTLAGEPRAIPNAGPQNTCVGWTGSEYIVGWLHATFSGRGNLHGTVNATLIGRDGVHRRQEAVSNLRGPGHLACAAGEAATLFVWAQEGWELGGVLRAHAGAVSGRIPLTDEGFWPAVAANGRTFAVAWVGFAVNRAIVSEHGTVTVPNEPPLPRDFRFDDPPSEPVALAPFGSGYLLVWGTRDLRALALDAQGRSAGTTTISATGGFDIHPAIAGGKVPVVLYTRGDRVFPHSSDLRVYARTITALPQQPRTRSVRK